jgi:zinc transport system substrate-binding protein
MNKNVIIPFILGFIFIGVVSYFVKNIGNPASTVQTKDTSKIQVVASFYPLYFFSSQIGGDKALVTNIVPAGAEPHDYEPTAQDMAKMESSKLIVLNGGGLEAWSDDMKKNIDTKNTAIITAGEGLTTQQVTEDGETGTDPHVWLDPPLAEKMVDKITQGFQQVDPANKDYYQANANALKAKLSDLDLAYKQGLSSCKEKNIITSHAAFGYLAMTYGLNQVSIAGLSPDAEPSPSQLADIVKFAKDNNVKYIFFESLVSPKLSQTIATEIGAKTLVLNPIEGLSDEELAQGKNYLTVMQDNLTNLQTALQCNK